LLISGVLANWALQILVVGLEFLLARAIFHIPWPPNLPELLVVGTLGLFAFAGIGMVIASVANTSQETQVLCNLLWFAFMFLSGATAPLAQLPEVIRHVALFLPSFYLVFAIQGLMFGGSHLPAMIPEIAALSLTTATAYLLSLKLFRWDQQMRLSWRTKAWAIPALVPFVALGVWANLFSQRINQALALYAQVWPR
jgi:ABC-type multidrug transport system permease subunit